MTTQLLAASKHLMTRPADEHFATFADMTAAALKDKTNARTVNLDAKTLAVTADANGGLVLGRKGGTAAYPMTYHGARAMLRLAGASPEFVFERLSPATAATALTEALSKSTESVQLLIGTTTGADGVTVPPRVRAITSQSYCRVWDADVYEEIDRWLIGAGYAPALPTKNTDAQKNNIMGNNKPCLFRGDGSSFAFFMHEQTAPGAGDRPVRRGVFVPNSEVGKSSTGATRFLFDDLCANFIVWNARAVQKLKIIHRGRSDGHLLRRLARELQAASPDIAQQELDVLRKAADKVFAKDTEEAAERLNVAFGLSLKDAAEAVKRAGWA